MSLLQMSLYATVMIIVIASVRGLLLNFLPKRTFILLWSIVLLRLLLPFQISSVFSAYTLSSGVNHASWILMLWALGALGVSGYFATSYYFCMREFRMGLPIDNEFLEKWHRSHRLWRQLEIRQLDTIEAPISYGIIKPTILLPKTFDWTNLSGARYVMEHEFVHIQRGHLVLKLVMIVGLCVHCFNPTVWLMYVLLNRDIELVCDETVIRRFGMGMRKSYALTLINMEEHKNGLLPFYNAFGNNNIKGRIRSIMKWRKTTIAAVAVAAVLVLAISIGFLTTASGEQVKEIGAENIQVEEAKPSISEPELFEPEEIHDLIGASFELNETTYICDEEKLDWLEKTLQGAQEIRGVACPTAFPLYLTREDGSVGVIYPAIDSCANYQTASGYYNYTLGSGDNSEFWDCFGISDITELVLSREKDVADQTMYYLPEGASQDLVSQSVAIGTIIEVVTDGGMSSDVWRISTNPIPVTGRNITSIIVRDGNTGNDKVLEDSDAINEVLVGILEANVTNRDQESRTGYQYLLILCDGEEEVQRFSISDGFIETNQTWYFVESNERILSAVK